MGAVAHSSFTARGIAERQRAMAAEIERLSERNTFLEERDARRKAEAEAAREMLARDGLSERIPRMGPIAERICKATGFTMREIRSQRRSMDLVLARQAIAYWITRQTAHSMPAIGRFLGGRDHTTILHAIRTYPQKRAAMGRHLRPLDTGKRGN